MLNKEGMVRHKSGAWDSISVSQVGSKDLDYHRYLPGWGQMSRKQTSAELILKCSTLGCVCPK